MGVIKSRAVATIAEGAGAVDVKPGWYLTDNRRDGSFDVTSARRHKGIV